MVREATKDKDMEQPNQEQSLQKKRQKQIDESKQMIADALASLLLEHDYKELTLNEIADRAGVNRMTLYRHFKSKDKIILHIALRTMEKQRALIGTAEMPAKELIFRQLELVKKLPHLASLLKSGEIEDILYELRMTFHKRQLEQLSGLHFTDDPYFFHFVLGGMSTIIREWLKNGCKDSSRALADKIIALTRAFVMQHMKST
jgi:AcrR family transcriptional regulator